MTSPRDPEQINVHVYTAALWRRRWPILAVLILVPAVAYAISARNPKTYNASALIQVRLPLAQALGGTTLDQATSIAARLIQTRTVARAAASRLRPPARLDALTVSPDPTTGFITLTAIGRDPHHVSDVANAYAAAAVALQISQTAQQLDAAIHQTRAQRATLGPSSKAASGQLEQQLLELTAARAATPSVAQIAQSASAPRDPSSPKPIRAALLGLVIAVLLALLLTVLAEGADRRIRDVSALEEMSGLPLLSAVPRSAFSGPPFRPAVEESFARLRASLSYFTINREISSLLVASPGAEEGKTLASVNLAISYAHEGKSVVLVEADLRRPRIAERLGIKPLHDLGDVLVGPVGLSDALFTVPLDFEGSGRLRVLLAGDPPPNPAELLSSKPFGEILKRLAALGDVVVMDSSPLLAVSDALPLLQQVSGVVLLARLNWTSRDQLKRALSIIRATGATMLGVVATGTPDRGPYGYSGYLPRRPETTSSDGDGRPSGRRFRSLVRGRGP